MSPLPTHMKNRWLSRAEPARSCGIIYWHVLLYTDSQARAAAVDAQKALTQFPGLHMTPLSWLHITTLVAGSTDEISRDQMTVMLSEAQRLLSDAGPIAVAVRKVFYHPEAIVFPVKPAAALQSLRDAVQFATRKAIGNLALADETVLPWEPHITVSYSTAEQPAEPIISALGTSVRERQIIIDSLSLVIQWGPERLWDWEQVGSVSFRASGQAPDIGAPGAL